MRTRALPKPIKSTNPVVILRHVIKAIEKEPKRYDQSAFFDQQISPDDRDDYFPACGTVCCVAGWVNVLTGQNNLDYSNQEDTARAVLGLTFSEAWEFFAGGAVKSRSTIGARRHAKAGIAHIKRFALKKWGVKL